MAPPTSSDGMPNHFDYALMNNIYSCLSQKQGLSISVLSGTGPSVPRSVFDNYIPHLFLHRCPTSYCCDVRDEDHSGPARCGVANYRLRRPAFGTPSGTESARSQLVSGRLEWHLDAITGERSSSKWCLTQHPLRDNFVEGQWMIGWTDETGFLEVHPNFWWR